MSKAHRGKGVRELVKSGRKTCPLCKRTGIKVLYERDIEEKKIVICKQCNAAVANDKLKEAIAAL
jgi:ribosomal protein L37AE/L43A